jgi:hypothetical protein
MISTKDLRVLSKARLHDAEVLMAAKRFDAAFYICGYAVELALKARICRTLKWSGFPESERDFRGFRSVKTHDLEVLLRFSGIEARVMAKHVAEWAVVSVWNPENRYQGIGRVLPQQAANMISSVRRLLEVL